MSDPLKKSLPKWITKKGDGIILTIRATPRASRSEICGAEVEWLKVRLKAPPVDGKANKELLTFFAKRLKVSKSSVKFCSGESSRLKRILIESVKTEDILSRI